MRPDDSRAWRPSRTGCTVTRSREGSHTAAVVYSTTWNCTLIPLENDRYKQNGGILPNTPPHWLMHKLWGQGSLTQQVWLAKNLPQMVQILVTSQLTSLTQASWPTDWSRCIQEIKTNLVKPWKMETLWEWEFFYHLSSLSLFWYIADCIIATNSLLSLASMPFALWLHSSSH